VKVNTNSLVRRLKVSREERKREVSFLLAVTPGVATQYPIEPDWRGPEL
jgi:hypothetical protein